MSQRAPASVTSPLRSLLGRAAMVVATGFGSGFAPVAPGTAGTLVGMLLFWPIARVAWPWQLLATGLLFLLAVATAEAVARRVKRKDPGLVVVDEIVGIWVSMLFLPLTPLTLVGAFLLFRILDVVKPPPARRFESLPGGWGIVMDDAMAGVYTNLLLQGLLWIWPGGRG